MTAYTVDDENNIIDKAVVPSSRAFSGAYRFEREQLAKMMAVLGLSIPRCKISLGDGYMIFGNTRIPCHELPESTARKFSADV